MHLHPALFKYTHTHTYGKRVKVIWLPKTIKKLRAGEYASTTLICHGSVA